MEMLGAIEHGTEFMQMACQLRLNKRENGMKGEPRASLVGFTAQKHYNFLLRMKREQFTNAWLTQISDNVSTSHLSEYLRPSYGDHQP
jgi:hypothetical protein